VFANFHPNHLDTIKPSPNKSWCPMTLKELENQILALPPTEKAEIIQSLIQSISNGGKGITKTPGVCGGEACIAGTRIAVWLLVEARRLGISEAQLLQDYPHISAADLVNAWAYADAHPEEIEAVIRANEVA
jgi:uncharacterized protein (DUF433 family)